jgi:hypothetical protein
MIPQQGLSMKSALISLAFVLAAAGSVGAAGSGAAIAAAAASSAGGIATVEAGPSPPTATGATGGAPLGWNFFDAFYCVQFIDTDGNQWTSVFSKETPSQSFFTENIPYWANAFRSACPNGSLVGIHVTNSTNGTFDQVEVYGPGF